MQVKHLQWKRALRTALLVLLLSVVGMGKMYAVFYNVTIGDLRYDLNDNTLTAIVKGHVNGTAVTGSLTIPEIVTYEGNDYSVTSISDWAFSYCSGLTGSLTIPNSVTSIGYGAFWGCSGFTGSLTIGNSVTSIGGHAFWGCSGFTSSLTIGNSVTTIGESAFNNCSSFTGDLTIPNSVTTIGQHAFYGCSGFTGSLTIGNSVTSIGRLAFCNCSGFTGSLTIPNSVTLIDDNTFNGCSGFTGDLIIPNSVTSIGDYAFSYCNGLTGSLTIPNSVTSIGNYAFKNCSNWETIVVEASNIVYDSRDNCNAIIETSTNNLMFGCKNTIIPNSVTTIGNYAFYCCIGLTGSLTIPNSVTTIGSSAFYGCNGFTGSLTIGNSVTSVGDEAFRGCNGFTGSLTIPNSVTSIGSSAFYGCNGFTGSLTIGNSVTSVGDEAFRGCNGFTGSLTIPNSVTTIGSSAFYGCNGFKGSLTIPDSVTTIGSSAFSACGFTGSLTIPDSVTTIGSSAFYGCTSFTGNLTIGNSVTTIGSYAFSNCSGFTGSLTIGNSVTTISDYAFSNCNGFTGDLIIPNSVTSIGNYAFKGCDDFDGELIIGNSVTSIGYGAFSDCYGFWGSLTIPNSVISIGGSAFYWCSFMGTLTIGNSVTSIGDGAFRRCTHWEAIIVDTNNTVYDSRNNCNAIIETSTHTLMLGCKNTTIPNSVTSIGGGAFYCTHLQSGLTIPNSVTSIGSSAFYGCGGLGSSLTIPNSVTSIGSQAFYYCSGLSEIMMLRTTPPSVGGTSFSGTNYCPIYVPYESLNDYKTASGWSSYQSRIYPWLQKSIEGYGEDAGNWHFIASPIVANTAPTAVNNMITETAYDLYRFDQSEDLEWRNYEYPENTQDFMLVNGQGYLYANEEDVNLIFKGNFNEDDTKEVALAYTDDNPTTSMRGWNLIGNPFPVNAYADRSYYVMNEDGTAIEPVAVSMETAIPACTGVMVKAETTGESVTFSKTAPETQGQNNGMLQIAVANANTRGNATEDKAIVSFNVGDALEKFVFNKNNAQICIPQNGKDYAIAYAEKTGEIPVNFKAAKNDTYTINVNANDMEFNYLHLIDNLTGADIDLLVAPEYTFEAKTSDYASRFRLVFSVYGDADGDDETPFAFVNNGEIVITADVSDASLQIVDMMGRVVVSVGGRTRCVPTAGMASGMYILRLINGDDVKTQKVVIR